MVADEFALVVIQQTNLGRADAMGGAMQQPGTQLFFHSIDLLGGGGLADAHFGGGFAERAQVHHSHK